MKNLTDITFILDRSGSMASVKSDTIGGFNTFLQEQKSQKGEAVVSLYQFDDKYDVVYENESIKNASELTENTFVPRGMTALYDAIGKTVVTLGERLSKLDESERPDKVVVVILTDGFENASKEYKQNQIFEMIKHQTDKYNWQFLFLGANIDAVKTGNTIGIKSSNSMTFAADRSGIHELSSTLSKKISNYRSTGITASLEFNDEDRQKQKR